MAMTASVIEHTVTFRLIHTPGSVEESGFLSAAGELAAIPGVHGFQIRKQTTAKNPHTFGISMQFADQIQYQAYCEHPAHVDFVQQRWLKEVADFQEADFAPLSHNSGK